MARFRFNLQAVLEQRKRVERAHQRRVALLEQERLGLEREIDGQRRALTSEQDDLRLRLFEAGGGRLHLPQVRQQAAASIGLMARAQRSAVALAGVLRRLDAARADLIKATAARRGVEVLRDRRFEAWKREQDRLEATALDEIVVTRRVRGDGDETGPGVVPEVRGRGLVPGGVWRVPEAPGSEARP